MLQSIYGEDAVKIWKSPSRSGSQSPDREVQSVNGTEPGTIRYEVTLRYVGCLHKSGSSYLPGSSIEAPSSDTAEESSHQIIVLVSLPPTYPASSPPQLQLLSRYIGPYGVDATLFGMVLRTFISRGAVEWTPDSVCVFDGLEWVKERCAEWLGERMSENKIGELMREDEKARPSNANDGNVVSPEGEGKRSARSGQEPPDIPATMPPGITITEAEPILDRKSAFVGRACRITDPSQVRLSLSVIQSVLLSLDLRFL